MARALLILDPQVGWQHETIDPIFDKVREVAASFDGMVVSMQFVNNPDSLFTQNLHWTRFQKEDDQALLPGYSEISDHVLTHETYGCLTPELEEIFKNASISEVYTCGVFTDVCVAMTAMQLFDTGRDSYVVTDLVGTLHGRKIHEATLRSFRHVIGLNYLVEASQLPSK